MYDLLYGEKQVCSPVSARKEGVAPPCVIRTLLALWACLVTLVLVFCVWDEGGPWNVLLGAWAVNWGVVSWGLGLVVWDLHLLKSVLLRGVLCLTPRGKRVFLGLAGLLSLVGACLNMYLLVSTLLTIVRSWW